MREKSVCGTYLSYAAFLCFGAAAQGLSSAAASLPCFFELWDANPLVWRFDAVTRTVRASGPENIAVYSAPRSARVRVSARVTPIATGTNSWSTLGVALVDDERNFWHVALAKAPPHIDGGRCFFELSEMREGTWLAHHADRLPVTLSRGNGMWRFGEPCVLTLESTPDGISARAADEKGNPLWERGYAFPKASADGSVKAVTGGRPAIRTTGGFRGVFADLDADWSEARPKTETHPAIPAYSSGSFVPGVTDKATGFFRVVEKEGRWWTIDPLGRGIVPLGVDHVTYHGHWSERTKRSIHHEVNKAKFPDKRDWEADALKRLKTWGFNMLGAGCDPALKHRGLVHTVFLSIGDSLCWSDSDPDHFICPNERRPCSAFPNVFHPMFPVWADYRARRLCAPNRDDPWLFGYFIDNELAWWGRGAQDTGLFEAVLRLPEGHSAKVALRRFLASRGVTGEVSASVKLDFLKLAADTYFRVSSEAIRRHDPNHLVMGARFAGLGGAHPAVWEISGKYCDLVTFNCYPWADLDRNVMLMHRGGNARRIAEAFTERYGVVKRPMLVTEWSFPALDSGLPCTGGAGQRFRTQALRTQATELFARTMLSLPFLLGYDYFMWVDEPAAGISDAFPEDSNYGLIDEQGAAYPAITEMFTRLHRDVGAARATGVPPERPASAPDGESAVAFLARKGRPGSATYTREGDRYIVRNAAGLELAGRTGGARIFDTVKLNGRLLGAYTGMWCDRVNGVWGWHDGGSVLSVDWREVSGRGVLRATFEGRPVRNRAVRQVHDITVFADRPWFLCDLVSLRNIGPESIELAHFYFREYAPFAFDKATYSPLKTVPNLWKASARDAWFGKEGGVCFGGATFASAVTHFDYALMDGGKSQHPDACFSPEKQTVLRPGDEYAPKGTMWMLAICGIDGVEGWSRAVRDIEAGR